MTEDILKKIQEVDSWMKKNGKTLGLAESCTGGLLSSWITTLAGVSDFYLGSVVSYSYSAKENILKVPSNTLKTHGAVSLPVARYMARGARQALACDWSVSITGIAGPDGGMPDKPVGTVCFAVSGPAFEVVEKKYFENKKRQQIQEASAHYALELLLESLYH